MHPCYVILKQLALRDYVRLDALPRAIVAPYIPVISKSMGEPKILLEQFEGVTMHVAEAQARKCQQSD